MLKKHKDRIIRVCILICFLENISKYLYIQTYIRTYTDKSLFTR